MRKAKKEGISLYKVIKIINKKENVPHNVKPVNNLETIVKPVRRELIEMNRPLNVVVKKDTMMKMDH